MRDDAVVIEVGLNESVSPNTQPHVPQTPLACASDAQRCADAGAAIVHWHAIDEFGRPQLDDVTLYGAALDAMQGCVLAYPSYRTDVPDDVETRLSHCIALHARHGLEIAPIDIATVNVVLWDPSTRELAPTESGTGFEVIRNSLPFVTDALARYRAVGLAPTLAAFDLGATRTLALLAEAGLLPKPVLCKIFLWASPAIGPVPSIEALDLHLRQLPAKSDVEWSVVPYGFTDAALLEQLVRAGLERGGGVRVGIGDSPGAQPDLTNAELVEQVVRLAGEVGRPVASADDVRERLAMPRHGSP